MTLQIDADAAGWGWFVDPTPGNHAEFRRASLSGSWWARAGPKPQITSIRSTVVMHELGHMMGLDSELAATHRMMSEQLAPGQRRLPQDVVLAKFDWNDLNRWRTKRMSPDRERTAIDLMLIGTSRELQHEPPSDLIFRAAADARPALLCAGRFGTGTGSAVGDRGSGLRSAVHQCHGQRHELHDRRLADEFADPSDGGTTGTLQFQSLSASSMNYALGTVGDGVTANFNGAMNEVLAFDFDGPAGGVTGVTTMGETRTEFRHDLFRLGLGAGRLEFTRLKNRLCACNGPNGRVQRPPPSNSPTCPGDFHNSAVRCVWERSLSRRFQNLARFSSDW